LVDQGRPGGKTGQRGTPSRWAAPVARGLQSA